MKDMDDWMALLILVLLSIILVGIGLPLLTWMIIKSWSLLIQTVR